MPSAHHPYPLIASSRRGRGATSGADPVAELAGIGPLRCRREGALSDLICGRARIQSSA